MEWCSAFPNCTFKIERCQLNVSFGRVADRCHARFPPYSRGMNQPQPGERAGLLVGVVTRACAWRDARAKDWNSHPNRVPIGRAVVAACVLQVAMMAVVLTQPHVLVVAPKVSLGTEVTDPTIAIQKALETKRAGVATGPISPLVAAEPLPSVPPLKSGVVLRLSAKLVESSGAVDVRAETNLPESTIIAVTVREPGDYGEDYGDNVTVRRGRIGLAVTGRDGAKLPDGEYVAELLMPVPDAQPPEVEAILGDGRDLKGPLVKRGGVGVTVYTSAKIVIGSISKGQQRRRASKAFVQAALRQYQLAVQHGRAIDRADPSCFTRSRSEWDAINEFSSKLDHTSLVWPGVNNLRSAVGMARVCVSCSDDFKSSCDDVSKELSEAAGEISKSRVQ